MEHNNTVGEDHIQGMLKYLKYTGDQPVNYLYDPPKGAHYRSGLSVAHTMRVCNGSQIVRKLTLDREGFAFVRTETRIVNFYDPVEVKRVYHPEVECSVREVIGVAEDFDV